MKKILLILLISFSLISYGKSINKDLLQFNYSDFSYHEIDKEIPYTGEWIGYYENGEIKYKGNYKGNSKNGESVWYYKNGQIKAKLNYKNGESID